MGYTGIRKVERLERGKEMKHLILLDADKDLLIKLHDFVYLDTDFIFEHIYTKYPNAQTTRNRLNTLVEAGYLKFFKGAAIPGRTKNTGNVYTLTSTGVSVVEEIQGYSKWSTYWTKELPIWYRHSIMLARAAISYMEKAPDVDLAVKDYVQESRASYEYGGTSEQVIRPDGFMIIGAKDREENFGIFMEMERFVSKRLVVQDKIRRYEEFLNDLTAQQKYQYKIGAEEEVSFWKVLFISETKESMRKTMKVISSLKPKVGESPNPHRPGFEISVILTSLDQIQENPLGAIYHHMDSENYEEAQTL